MLELGDFLCDAPNRAVFERMHRMLSGNTRVEIVPISQTILDRAAGLYFARRDKDWSLTDCTSFIIMADRGITDALTGDHHFVQAGFRALLKAEH